MVATKYRAPLFRSWKRDFTCKSVGFHEVDFDQMCEGATQRDWLCVSTKQPRLGDGKVASSSAMSSGKGASCVLLASYS